MKKIISLAVLAVTLSAFTACAQQVVSFAQSLTIPTVAAGGTSNSIGQVIDCTKAQNVAIQWTSGSTNITVRLGASLDAVTWTTNRYVLQLGDSTGDGTALKTVTTNLSVGAVRYLVVDSVLSTGTVNATNTVTYASKGAP